MKTQALSYEVQKFADFAVLCHDRDSALKTMALITAYGDESSDKDRRILSVSAFVGRADDWTALLNEWIERLNPKNLPNPVTAFHMTDCESGQGEFRDKFGWTEESRKRLIIDLIGIITRHHILLFGAGLQIKDYGNLELINGDPVGRSEYHILLQALMCDLSLELEESNAPAIEDIAYIFDQRDKRYEFWAHEIHRETKNHPQVSWRHRLGTLSFADKRDMRLLQVADLGAYEVRRYITQFLFNEGKTRKSFEVLAAAKKIGKISVYDGETLQKIVEKKKEELALLS